MSQEELKNNLSQDYWVFISYSHADKETARWLHKKLEGYKIPKDLVGMPTRKGAVPRSFHRVFRDEDELSANPNLYKSLYAALDNSQNLIVICSPNSAQSEAVNKEVIYFKDKRGQDRVSCLIVAGVPHAEAHGRASSEECFCRALRFEINRGGSYGRALSPLAADLREPPEGVKSKKNHQEAAFLKVVAGVLGIEFDALYQRHRRQRIKRTLAFAAIGIVTMAVLGAMALRLEEVRKSLQKTTALVNRMDETTHREFGKLPPERESEWKQLIGKFPIKHAAETIEAAIQSESSICATYSESAIRFDEAVTTLTPRFEKFLASVCPEGGWRSSQKNLSQCSPMLFQAESPFLGPNMSMSSGKIRSKWIAANSISASFLENLGEAESMILEMKNILKMRPVDPRSQHPIGHHSPFDIAITKTEDDWNAFVNEIQNFAKTPEEKFIADSNVEILEKEYQKLINKLHEERQRLNLEMNRSESIAFRENRWSKESSGSARHAIMCISRLIFINGLNEGKTPTLDTKAIALAKRFSGLADWVFWGGAPGTE
jgi:hypothetical protein